MNRFKKIWSLAMLVGVVLSSFPLSIFAETTEDVELAGVVIKQALITDTGGQEITESNRVNHQDTVMLKLDWSLTQATLLEENTIVTVDLPSNLNFPDQSGSLDGMGIYQVSNQELVFQFNKNYKETEVGQVPDFSSVNFYKGTIELSARTTSEDLEIENVNFGNDLVSTIYYAKNVESATKTLEQSSRSASARTHEPNLNERPVEIFTNIKITNQNGEEFTEKNPAVKDANIKIHFDWILDNDEIIKSGDYYTYQLPDYFSIHNPVNGELENEDGDTLGTFNLNESGLLTVSFNSKAENLSDRQGTIDLNTELNIQTDTERVEISTGITDEDSEEIKIVIPIVKAYIDKKGIIGSDNTVSWTIVVNEDRSDLRNAVITDTLPEGLSVWYHQYYVMNDANEWETAPSGFIQAWQAGDKYIYKFSSEVMKQPVKIILHMKVEDKSQTDFVNNVTINGSNFNSNSSEASVSFKSKDNYKYSTGYNLNTGEFDWKIKATYTNDGGVLKDWMYSRYKDPNTANHYLIKDSIKVYDDAGEEIPSNKWSFSEDEADFKQKNGEYVHFTLKFSEKGVYNITYTTQSFEVPTPIKTDLMNTALVIDGSNSEQITGSEKPDVEGELGVGKGVVSKDFSKNTIDWRITLNTKRIVMKNAVITDQYTTLAGANKSALQLIDESLEVIANDGSKDVPLTRNKDYILKKIAGDSDYSSGFIIELIGKYESTSDEIRLEYSTKYFVDKQEQTSAGAVLRFCNSVVVTYNDENGKAHTDGDEVATWIDSRFYFNGVKYGKFIQEGIEVGKAFSHDNPFSESIALENSVYWSAVFNTWQTTIPENTIIREELGEGQTLKELVIYDVNIATNKVEVASLGNKWVENVDYSYELDDGVPVIKLLKQTEKTFAIFVSASASDEIHKYKNVASMTVQDRDVVKVEGMAEKSDKSNWIDKKGVQGSDEDYRLINWSVVLNKDGHKIINPVVTDTVSINEQSFVYDADKNVVVKVYPAAKDSAGNFVKTGSAIDFAEDEQPVVTSDSILGTQTLTISLGNAIDTPYIIEYQTLLDPGIQNNEIVKNSASLYGNDIQYHETTTSVTVKSTNGTGTSSGKNGAIKFEKLDTKNQLITTDSAYFDLYRKDRVGNLSLLFSDIEVKGDKIIENNEEVDQLSNLRYGTYVIVESKAPNGYVKDATEYEILISSLQTTHTFTLQNRSSTNIILEAKKALIGRDLQAEEFSFKLTGEDVEQTKTNDADGKIVFDEISYNRAGTYKYTISEEIPVTQEVGLTYDESKYEVTVTVAEKDGVLEATAVYETVQTGELPVFTNTYKALPGSVKLEAKKALIGRDLQAEEFSFKLTGEDVEQTKTNDADGKIVFDEISYNRAGTYKYTISEEIPVTQEVGLTYDETKYEVTVTVAEKDGVLEATAVYETVQTGELPVFTNTYKALPGSVKLEAKKALIGRDLQAEEFSFKLTGEDVEQTKTNDADGKIVFDEISYNRAGTYKYTISEIDGSEVGMTYDSHVINVIVEVKNVNGQLTAEVTYTGDTTFTNIYKIPTKVIKKTKTKLLPATNDTINISILVLGVTISAVSVAILYFRRKKIRS